MVPHRNREMVEKEKQLSKVSYSGFYYQFATLLIPPSWSLIILNNNSISIFKLNYITQIIIKLCIIIITGNNNPLVFKL